MQRQELIKKSEELFAREVALGVVVTRPLKSWLYLIPGMFIVDFLRRQRSIRRYTNYYMFPRKQALAGAAAIMEGTDPDHVTEDIETALRYWLSDRPGDRIELKEFQMRVIRVLIDHYQKLLSAQAIDYIQLLRDAYANREELEAVLKQLNELERERDQCMPDCVMDDYQKHHFNAIQSQVVMRRTDLIEAVFNF